MFRNYLTIIRDGVRLSHVLKNVIIFPCIDKILHCFFLPKLQYTNYMLVFYLSSSSKSPLSQNEMYTRETIISIWLGFARGKSG